MEILVEMDGQIKVDDDNLPVLENVPTGDIWHTDEVFLEWRHGGVYQQWQAGGQSVLASLFNFESHTGLPSILQTFEMLYPTEYNMKKVIINEINKKLDNKKMAYEDFFVWMGVWFFMGTINFGDRRDI